ncbi:MAG: SlyX family protein [Planctomycetales bacterium]|nr:SlyX family protein [Planctomycetales bacterium]
MNNAKESPTQLSELQQQIKELQIQLLHQQRLCEQLNEVVTDHTRQLLQYERIHRQLDMQLQDLRQWRRSRFDPGEERPPHW